MYSSSKFTNYIFKYIRDANRQVYGIVGAFKICPDAIPEKHKAKLPKKKDLPLVVIGYAICGPRDKFNRDSGLKLAGERAFTRLFRGKSLYNKNAHYSQYIGSDIEQMVSRAVHYFKDAEIIV